MTNQDSPAAPAHLVSLPGGRTLAFDEYGMPEGMPVVFLGAAPSSRLLDPRPDVTRAMDVRLLTVDRPGYGASSPVEDGQAPSWGAFADDLAEALRTLGIVRAGIAGWSNGGLGGLALAARHPSLVSRLVVAGTPAPHEEVPWIPEEFVPFLARLREDPANAVAALAPMLAAPPEAAVAELGGGPDDARALEDPERRDALQAMLVEAYRQGGVGAATDIVATNVAPWGFDLASVEAPVTLLYGGTDTLVPAVHGEWYASRLPHATLEVVDGTGHLLPLTHWERVLAAAR